MQDPKVLLCWVGKRDLGAVNAIKNSDRGPIAMALDAGEAFSTDGGNWTEVNIISDKPETDCSEYFKWLQTQTSAKVFFNYVKSNITHNLGQIYEDTLAVIKGINDRYRGKRALLFFHVGS